MTHYIENTLNKIDRVFTNIENEVLDEYNQGKISGKEMENIVAWCEKMRNIKKKELIEQS